MDLLFTPLQKCKQRNEKSVYIILSSKNRFVGGTKAGHVGIWNGKSVEKSIKLFTNSVQEKNATLVQYCDGIIYAAAEDSCVTKLDMNLKTRKVIGTKIEELIFTLVASHQYVAFGGVNK